MRGRKRETRTILGIAYSPVNSNEARTHIVPIANTSDAREVWRDPAVKFAEHEIVLSDWTGIPVRDTHGRHDVGRVIYAWLEAEPNPTPGREPKKYLKVAVEITNDTPHGAKAVRDFDEAKFFGFSVKYDYYIQHHTGRVLEKRRPQEVSLCKEPFFNECVIQVSASADKQSRVSDGQTPVLFQIMSSTPAPTSDETSAPTSNQAETTAAPEAEKPAPVEQTAPQAAAVPEQHSDPKVQALIDTIAKQRALLQEKDENMGKLVKVTTALQARRQKEVDEQIAPFLSALEKISGEEVPETAQKIFRRMAIDPALEDWTKKLGVGTVSASKRVEEYQNLKRENEEHAKRHANVSRQAEAALASVAASGGPAPTAERSNLELFNQMFTAEKGYEGLFSSPTGLENNILSASNAAYQQMRQARLQQGAVQTVAASKAVSSPPPAQAAPTQPAESPAPAGSSGVYTQSAALFPKSMVHMLGEDFMQQVESMTPSSSMFLPYKQGPQ